MSKIDCSITENYLKEKARMTTREGDSLACSIACVDCPMGQYYDNRRVLCNEFQGVYPAKAIAIVQKWSDEHPAKTIKDDFLEKHPNAPKAATGTPLACAWRVGYLDEDGCLSGRCTECWNRPLSEV